MCFSYKVAKAVQTVKLTPYHRSTASLLESSIIGFAKGVDIQTLIHRNEPNRPHISSVYSIVKQRQVIRPRDKNQHEAPISTGANRVNTASNSFQTSLPEPSSQSAPSAQQHLSAAGEGVFTDDAPTPQPQFRKNFYFIRRYLYYCLITAHYLAISFLPVSFTSCYFATLGADRLRIQSRFCVSRHFSYKTRV